MATPREGVLKVGRLVRSTGLGPDIRRNVGRDSRRRRHLSCKGHGTRRAAAGASYPVSGNDVIGGEHEGRGDLNSCAEAGVLWTSFVYRVHGYDERKVRSPRPIVDRRCVCTHREKGTDDAGAKCGLSEPRLHQRSRGLFRLVRRCRAALVMLLSLCTKLGLAHRSWLTGGALPVKARNPGAEMIRHGYPLPRSCALRPQGARCRTAAHVRPPIWGNNVLLRAIIAGVALAAVVWFASSGCGGDYAIWPPCHDSGCPEGMVCSSYAGSSFDVNRIRIAFPVRTRSQWFACFPSKTSSEESIAESLLAAPSNAMAMVRDGLLGDTWYCERAPSCLREPGGDGGCPLRSASVRSLNATAGAAAPTAGWSAALAFTSSILTRRSTRQASSFQRSLPRAAVSAGKAAVGADVWANVPKPARRSRALSVIPRFPDDP